MLLAATPFLSVAVVGEFVYDDWAQVVRNERVQSLDPRPVLSGPSVTHGTVEWYRPLTIYTFALNYAAVGLRPALYRITNVGLHVANTLLVRAVGTPLVGGVAASIGAAIFAVAAVHVEAVSPAFGRADLLATFWVLLGWWWAHGMTRETWVRAIVVAAAFLAGLLSKESAVALLPMIVLADAVAGRRRLRLYGSLAATLGVWVTLRFWAVGAVVASGSTLRYIENPLVESSILERVVTATWILLKYAALLIVPYPLSADYSYRQIPVIESVLEPRLLMVLGVLVCFGLVAWRKRWLAKVVAAFVVLMAPVSNLLFPIGTIMAERLVYLPSVALCLGAGVFCAEIARKSRGLSIAGVAIVVIMNIIGTVNRSAVWLSDEVLFEATARTSSRSAKAQFNLGALLLERGEVVGARRHLQEAVEIAPAYPEARNLLGTLLMARGSLEQAAQHLRVALDAAPHYAPALANLGMVLVRQRRYAEARPILELAIDRDPRLATAYVQLAFISEEGGDLEEAIRFYRIAFALDPSLEVARQRAEELTGSRK